MKKFDFVKKYINKKRNELLENVWNRVAKVLNSCGESGLRDLNKIIKKLDVEELSKDLYLIICERSPNWLESFSSK